FTASRMFRACAIISSSMPRRPAVSTMTTSCCWNWAVETPFIATSTGSPTPLPGSGANTGTPARSPTTCSWFTALGRWRSAATSRGACPSDFIHFASLPARVVLPAPWRPASMITVGGFLAKCRSPVAPPSTSTSSSLTILTTCWAGLSALDLFAQRPLTDPAGELAHHRDGHVGVEQGTADLADRLVDVRLGEAAMAAQTLQRCCDAIGEVVEHEALPLGRMDRISLVRAARPPQDARSGPQERTATPPCLRPPQV